MGLTFLASVGATAPFIGLFGTVWGFTTPWSPCPAQQGRARQGGRPGGRGADHDRSRPFVAIPAVLAYNALTRANRLIFAQWTVSPTTCMPI